MVEWGRTDQGRFALKAELVSPEGQVVLTVDGHSEVDARPAPAAPARTRLVMSLEKVVFPRPGRYHLRIVVKGKRFKGPSLHLMEMEGGAQQDPAPEDKGLERPEGGPGTTPEPGDGPSRSIKLPQV